MGSTSSREAPDPDTGQTHLPPQREARTTRSKLIHLTRAVNKFSVFLYQELAKDGKKPGNLLVCPLGVSLGLALLLLGAEGKSRDELWRTMYLQEVVDNQDLMAPFAAMHWDTLMSNVPKGCIVEMAVRLFVPSGVTMTHDYEDVCTQFEITKMHNVDFVNRHDLARKEINQWVQERTHGIVQDVIPPTSIVNRDTRLLLLCVTHVKVRWRNTFISSKTTKAPFYLALKETLQVHMMHQKCELNYGTSDKLDCDIVEMPFENQYTKMYIFLPRKKDGLSKLEKGLARSMLEQTIDDMVPEMVELFLPRFQFASSVQLNDKLQSLGIRDIFSQSKADLSFLSAEKLHVSSVYHHVHIEYEECESCNASSSNIAHLSVPSHNPTEPHDVKKFKADHPFMFLIRDIRTGSMWMLGRVVRPEVA